MEPPVLISAVVTSVLVPGFFVLSRLVKLVLQLIKEVLLVLLLCLQLL